MFNFDYYLFQIHSILGFIYNFDKFERVCKNGKTLLKQTENTADYSLGQPPENSIFWRLSTPFHCLFTFTILFSHLADALIQSDLEIK